MAKKRVFVVLVPIVLVFSLFGLTAVLMASAPDGPTVCDVPSGPYLTIQIAVDDVVNCDIVNLIQPFYTENVTINRPVQVQGQGMDNTVVDGGGVDTVFDIQSSGSVTLTGMTVQNGNSQSTPYTQGGGVRVMTSTVLIDDVRVINNTAELGAGIFSDNSTLLITNSRVISNSADILGGGITAVGIPATVMNSQITSNDAGSFGGGFYGFGTIIRSTFAGNSASYGGGLYGFGITVTQSTLIVNSATSAGGGIYAGFGTLDLRNSTVSYNLSGDLGGGVFAIYSTTATINNSTFIGNDANTGGAVAYQTNSTVIASNSIFANSNGGGDCGTAVTTLGYNIDSDGSCGLNSTGDQPNTDPLVGVLQNNGGQTFTHALLPGSPALDKGSLVVPGGSGACETIDQRGIGRPQDGDGNSVSVCDIGSYEEPSINVNTFHYLPIVLR